MKVSKGVVKGCFHCPARTSEKTEKCFIANCTYKGGKERIATIDLQDFHPLYTGTWFPSWCPLEDVEE